MGFLAPWFLAGLAAAAIPIYVHLLRQHKTTPRPFSSLMFFEKRTQSSVKHRRLKYLTLLSLRLALLLLLALTFANFFVRRTGPVAGGNRLVVVAIDNSLSMRAGNRLEQAKQEAANVIASMGGNDRGQVLSFNSGVTLMTQPVSDRNELRSAIQSVRQSDGRSLYGEVARALRSIAQSARTPVEAHVFSDLQKSSLPSPFSELALAANTTLKLHQIGKAEPNWFVESVQAPQSVYQPKNVRIRATLAGAGTEARDLTATLSLNGKPIDSKPAKLGPNGRGSVEFVLNDAPHGMNRGEVRIAPGDTLANDDAFPFAFERKEMTRVLFVHEARGARSVLFYRAALDASPDGAFSLEPVTPDQAANVSLQKYGYVVLSDVAGLPGPFEGNLKNWVQGGGSLLLALGPISATRPRVPVLDSGVLESRYAARGGDRFQTASSVDSTHPALWKAQQFEGVKFYQSVRIDPGSAKVLARLTDGTPLVAERRIGEGKVIAFMSTFDNIANDLPVHASFVPFVEQTAKYLAGMDPTPALYAVGDFVELRSARDRGTGVEVIGPGGQRELSLKEATSAQNFRLDREGYFEVRRANGRHELIAVHGDRLESDLAVIPEETQKLWAGAGLGTGAPGEAGDGGPRPYSLWWWFALALLLVALAESILASRYLSAEQDVAKDDRSRVKQEAA